MSKANKQKRQKKVHLKQHAYPWTPDSRVAGKKLTEQLLLSPDVSPDARQDIKESFLIDATPVSDYLFTGTDQEEWKINKDFPNIAPPYPQFFLEFRAPDKIVSKKSGTTEWENMRPSSWGILCRGVEIAKITPWSRMWEDFTHLGARWALSLQLFYRYMMDEFVVCEGPIWETQILAGEHGEPILREGTDDVLMIGFPSSKQRNQFIKMQAHASGQDAQSLAREHYNALSPYFNTAFLTLSFLHCKNVVVRTREDTSTKLLYHDIDILPMRKILQSEGHSDELGTESSISICRGHFKHYENGRGLFGKHKGALWFPMQARGVEKSRD